MRCLTGKNKGFTLLECLLALLFLAGTLVIMDGLIRHASAANQQISSYHDREWEIFLLQLTKRLENSQLQSVSASSFKTAEEDADGKTIIVTYEKYDQSFRRRAKNGHELYLTGVKSFVCIKEEGGIRFEVEFFAGQKKTGRWLFP